MGQDGVSLGLPEMMHHEKDNHEMLKKLTLVDARSEATKW